jgi:hypothetical protein
MPKLESGAFEGTDLFRVRALVVTASEVKLTVFATDDLLFRRFIDASYDAHVMVWEASHPQGSFTVTREEWMRYAFTALRSRLARVNDEGGFIRSDDNWQIPAMWATILNAIGRVNIDAPAMQYVPVWNVEYDAMVMRRDEWNIVTSKMRALASDRDNAKFIFVRGLTGDRTGDPIIMDIVPVRDATGRIVRLHSDAPFDGVAAFVYLACGFLPEAFVYADLQLHPRYLPRRYMPVEAVEYGAQELGFRSVAG